MKGPWFLGLIGSSALAACATLADLDLDGKPGPSVVIDAGLDAESAPPTPEGLVVSPEVLSIATPCGASAEKPILLSNGGKEEVTWEVSVPDVRSLVKLKDPNGTLVDRMTGSVLPGNVVQVPVVITASVPGVFPGGDILIKTPRSTRQVRTALTINGGRIVFTPSTVDFGEVKSDRATTPQEVAIENVGNQVVNVTGFEGADGDFKMSTGSVSVAPGEKKTVSASFSANAAGAPLRVQQTPVTESPLCGDPPILVLQGTRVTYDVTVVPGGVDFGDIDCNSTPTATKTFVATNYGAFQARVRFTAAEKFTVTPLEQELQSSNGTATFTIQPKPTGSDVTEQTETLSVEITTLPAGTTRNVTLHARYRVAGAILTVPSALGGFTDDEPTRTFAIQNIGNKAIRVGHVSSNGDFSVAPETDVPTVSFASVPVKLEARASGPRSATISTSRKSGAVLCKPVPDISVAAP